MAVIWTLKWGGLAVIWALKLGRMAVVTDYRALTGVLLAIMELSARKFYSKVIDKVKLI
jgi:hypothetical protein